MTTARHVAVARATAAIVIHGQRGGYGVGHGPAPARPRAQGNAEQGRGGQLGGVGFGGGHGPLLAGAQVEHHIPLLGQRRVGAIGQHGRQRPLPARLGQHSDDVGALAALADAQHQGDAEARRALVEGEQTRRGQPD
jgi:hypothetical protein